MVYICILIIGIIIGCVITIMSTRIKSIGALRIDYSDPDGPYLFLEIASHPDLIRTKRYITLQVKSDDFISHK